MCLVHLPVRSGGHVLMHCLEVKCHAMGKQIAKAGLQIYGGPGSLSHDFKIWPITFQGCGPSGPILFSC